MGVRFINDRFVGTPEQAKVYEAERSSIIYGRTEAQRIFAKCDGGVPDGPSDVAPWCEDHRGAGYEVETLPSAEEYKQGWGASRELPEGATNETHGVCPSCGVVARAGLRLQPIGTGMTLSQINRLAADRAGGVAKTSRHLY